MTLPSIDARTFRFVNVTILILLLSLTATGLYSLTLVKPPWLYDVHRILGWGLLMLVPLKAAISWRSLKRGFGKRGQRIVAIATSISLLAALISVFMFALMWTWRFDPEKLWFRQSAIAWHWILALILLIPLLVHVWQKWPRPKVEDFTERRALLRGAGILATGIGGWVVVDTVSLMQNRSQTVRFTGSRDRGQFTGNSFPITGEYADPVNLEAWSLTITGLVSEPRTFTYADLRAMAQETRTATIDCTLGWYSTQHWTGVPLADLMSDIEVLPAATTIVLKATTKFGHIYPLTQLDQMLLATHVGDEPLAHWHGFPLRAVVPNMRGWYWVKWLTEVHFAAISPDTIKQLYEIRT